MAMAACGFLSLLNEEMRSRIRSHLPLRDQAQLSLTCSILHREHLKGQCEHLKQYFAVSKEAIDYIKSSSSGVLQHYYSNLDSVVERIAKNTFSIHASLDLDLESIFTRILAICYRIPETNVPSRRNAPPVQIKNYHYHLTGRFMGGRFELIIHASVFDPHIQKRSEMQLLIFLSGNATLKYNEAYFYHPRLLREKTLLPYSLRYYSSQNAYFALAENNKTCHRLEFIGDVPKTHIFKAADHHIIKRFHFWNEGVVLCLESIASLKSYVKTDFLLEPQQLYTLSSNGESIQRYKNDFMLNSYSPPQKSSIDSLKILSSGNIELTLIKSDKSKKYITLSDKLTPMEDIA